MWTLSHDFCVTMSFVACLRSVGSRKFGGGMLWPFSFSYSVTHLSHHHLMDHPAAATGQVGHSHAYQRPWVMLSWSRSVIHVARPPWLGMRLNECGLDAVSVLSERVGVSCSGSERRLAEWRVVSWIWFRTVNDSLDSRQRRRTPFGWRRHADILFVLLATDRSSLSVSSSHCEHDLFDGVDCVKNVVEGRYNPVWRSGLNTPRQALGHACHRCRLNRILEVYGEVQSSAVPTCELQVLPSTVILVTASQPRFILLLILVSVFICLSFSP